MQTLGKLAATCCSPFGFGRVKGESRRDARVANPGEGLPRRTPETLGIDRKHVIALDKFCQNEVSSGKCAGLSVAVARDGYLFYMAHHGVATHGGTVPLNNNTIFKIMSVTKCITSTAVMILVEDGDLEIDDPVSKYIPTWKNLKVWQGEGKEPTPVQTEMTIRHLLTHTSGMYIDVPALAKNLPREQTDAFGHLIKISQEMRKKALKECKNLEQYVDRLSKIPLMHEPGTKWFYSAAHVVVGRVIEIASGQNLGEFMDERIFQPLKMDHTSFMLREKDKINVAPLHSRGAKGLTREDTHVKYNIPKRTPAYHLGDAGCVSSVSDMVRFGAMISNGGYLEGHRILMPDSVKKLCYNAMPQGVDNPYGMPGVSFGLGGINFMNKWWGWNGMLSTHLLVGLDTKLSVVVMRQTEPYQDISAEIGTVFSGLKGRKKRKN